MNNEIKKQAYSYEELMKQMRMYLLIFESRGNPKRINLEESMYNTMRHLDILKLGISAEERNIYYPV